LRRRKQDVVRAELRLVFRRGLAARANVAGEGVLVGLEVVISVDV